MADITVTREHGFEYAAGLLEAAILLEDLGYPFAADLHLLASRLETQLFGGLPGHDEEPP
jgi:hypothetical protein